MTEEKIKSEYLERIPVYKKRINMHLIEAAEELVAIYGALGITDKDKSKAEQHLKELYILKNKIDNETYL